MTSAAPPTPWAVDVAEPLDAPERLVAVSELFALDGRDPELLALVDRAATETGFPMAYVSLVLRRTQRFVAAQGLPPDLAISKATDRCNSFAQIVVCSGASLEVADVRLRDDLPAELPDAYGTRAYVGLPLRVDDAVVGTLSVCDTEPHELTLEQRATLGAIAECVERRLAETARTTRRARRLTAIATRPGFEEARELLCRAALQGSLAEIALADVAPVVDLLRAAVDRELAASELVRNVSVLRDSFAACDDLRNLVGELRAEIERLGQVFGAIERAVLPRAAGPAFLREVLDAARIASDHETRGVGTIVVVPFEPGLALAAESSAAVAALALALGGVARTVPSSERADLHVRARATLGRIVVEITVEPADDETRRRIDAEVPEVIAGLGSIEVSARGGVVTLAWPESLPVESQPE